jgi:high affinity Mn2+ porin
MDRFDVAAVLGCTALVCAPSLALADDAPAPAPADQIWAIHGQATVTAQATPAFHAAYSGPNSLFAGGQGRETADITLYAGLRLWRGAELWINPEVDQGFGLSDTFGVAGFPSGEAYKVGARDPYLKLPRLFVRETIDLGGESQSVDPDLNQLDGRQTADRIVVTLGKFGVTDLFDTNGYAHDPRSDFMNWTLIDTGTFDYAADAWGYTYGAAVEWYQGPWTMRAGVFNLSTTPNSPDLVSNFSQFQTVLELEQRHRWFGRDGKMAVTGFMTRGRMGSFEDALRRAALTGQPADITAVRRYQGRGGVSVNVEQGLTDDLGLFIRAGLADGHKEAFEFTDVDKSIAAGLSLKGKAWGRGDDVVGLAGVVNGVSKVEERFFDAGGLGILIGDGRLTRPGPEQIVEAYYDLAVVKGVNLTFDYQFIDNPAYNRDRGPVSVFGARLHAQF